jgi:hypothetical protein
MKTHDEAKTCTTSRCHTAPVPNALAHQAQLRSALLRAGVQPRLEIGAVNDPLEREADAVAERVIRMPEPLLSSPTRGALQTATGTGGEGKLIQTKASPAPTTTTASPQLESSLNLLNSGGTPLPAHSRAFFEPRFGQDFSQVRLHTDANATHMADSLNARAFTLGNDIAFNTNQYSANTTAGRSLLGHELAHVIQQREGGDGGALRKKRVQREQMSLFPDEARVKLTEVPFNNRVGQMSNVEKLTEALKRSLPHMPEAAANALEAMLTPKNLLIMTGFIVAWAAAQTTPVGWVSDVLLVLLCSVTIVFLTYAVVSVANELYAFAKKAINAKNENDLEEAGKHFANAVAVVGITTILALLMKGKPSGKQKPPSTPKSPAKPASAPEPPVKQASAPELPVKQASAPEAPVKQPLPTNAPELPVKQSLPANVPELPVEQPLPTSATAKAITAKIEVAGWVVALAGRAAKIRCALKIGKGRNVAVAQYSIEGQSGELIGVSGKASRPGTVDAPANQIFDTIKTGNNPRTLDAEYKILSNLAEILNSSSRGVVNLYSELPVCVSCDGVIGQFQQRFPGVVVNVTTGTP